MAILAVNNGRRWERERVERVKESGKERLKVGVLNFSCDFDRVLKPKYIVVLEILENSQF